MKRGRPKKDYSYLSGSEFNELKIIGIRRNDRSGHPMCRTKCLVCRKQTTKRIHDVLKGKAKTCMCGSKRAFREFMENRVAALSDKKVEQIWIAVQDSPNVMAAAKALKVDRYLVDFAVRKHQRQLDSLPIAKKHAIWEVAQNAGIDAAAALFKLNRRSAAYIVGKMHNPQIHPGVDNEFVAWELEKLEADIERDPEKYESWFRRGEFRSNQLRRKVTGEVVGEYSDLYNHLMKYPQSPTLDPELANRIKWFLNTADKTFANRRERQLSFLRRKHENGTLLR